MSSHTRALDATNHLIDELTIDLVWLMRPRSYYWPAVIIGTLVGVIAGWVAGALFGWQWFFVLSGVIVFGGLGINVGLDFFFLALGSSGVYLVDSSRVTSRPVRQARRLSEDSIEPGKGRLLLRLTVDDQRYFTGPRYRDRLQRMLQHA